MSIFLWAQHPDFGGLFSSIVDSCFQSKALIPGDQLSLRSGQYVWLLSVTSTSALELMMMTTTMVMMMKTLSTYETI